LIAKTRAWDKAEAAEGFRFTSLEQFPKKLTDFFDENLLQYFDFERFLIDHMSPWDREAL
jgi:hypothetical protein